MSFISGLFGDENSRTLKKTEPLVAAINSFEDSLKDLSDADLKAKTEDFKKQLSEGKTLDDLLPEAFATVREASKRTLGQRHFDVQLIGGIFLHQGSVTEMRTGEGKTLVATAPAYLNALTGKGVHVITPNDYLSRVGVVWMGQIYNALGLTVSVITHESAYIYDESHISEEEDAQRDVEGSFKVDEDFLRPCTRKEAYEADITYGTNNEFGFDYLRDNLAQLPDRVVQREHNFAIVDEVDAILIDEARTPLIISAPAGDSESLYATFTRIADSLVAEEDYEVDEKLKAATLKDSGIEKAEKALGVENIYTDKGIKYVHHLETAVRAKAIYQRERDYVVRDGEVVIVDPFTGRMQPGRRWSEGLHQAIEAKEGVKVQQESRTFASITYQNYFRMYDKLSGMTGTAATSAEEFTKVYGLDVIVVPTNKPIARLDHSDMVYQTEQGKWAAIAKDVKGLHEKSQPVLIGTVSIERNELLSAYLKKEGIPHQVLNAKNHDKEGAIIAEAGKPGAVTIATNMAGRGVDIKLGGPEATEEEAQKIKDIGGLYVIGTERHEARRIDNQLRGRSGRQGDPGETQFYVSLEDDLMRVFGSEKIKGLMGTFNIPEDQPIESKLVSRALEGAQEKIEGFHFDSRKHVLEYDDVLNHQRNIIYGRRRGLLFSDTEMIDEYLSEIIDGDENLEKIVEAKKKELGDDEFLKAVRGLMLQVIDMLWVDHLESMDYLRSSVRLRAYGQRDPLVEYKREGLAMFKDLEEGSKHQVRHLLGNLGAIQTKTEEQKNLKETFEKADNLSKGGQNDQDRGSASSAPTGGDDIGRNDPCPCGSGKKYKKCGLVNSPDHKV